MSEHGWEPTRLYTDQDMVASELLEVGVGSLAVYSSRSPEKETPNEDAAAVIRSDAESGLLAVADGLGGAASGQHAASLALGALKTAVEARVREQVALRTAVLDGIEAANQVVVDMGVGAGTILVERGSVVGLTTAATLWVVAAIGLAVGAHAYVRR